MRGTATLEVRDRTQEGDRWVSARVKTALVAGAGVLAILFFGGELLFALLVAATAAIGAREYVALAGGGSEKLEALFVPLWAGVVALGFLAPSGELPGELLGLGAFLYFGVSIIDLGPREDTLRRWAAAVGAWVVGGLFLGHMVRIRSYGVAPVVFLSAIVWTGDTAAYYVGRAVGSRPLAAAVSPKKTVEGAVASVAGGALAAFVLALFLPLPHGAFASLLLGVVLNLAAQTGDLAESLLKRCAGVKDSGALFPGHGGMLDRADAFLFAAPLYALLLRL